MDIETKNLLVKFNQQVPETDTPTPVDMTTIRAGARAMFLSLAGEIRAKGKVKSIDIPSSKHTIPARVYYPENAENKDELLPSTIFFHGGGWSLGDLDCYDQLMRDLAELSGAIFISVDYRLAPEHKFPAGLNDAYHATLWLAENMVSLGGNMSKLALMGDSAGGNLALVTANRLHQTSLLRLAALYLIYPVLDVASPHETYQSRIDFGDGNYLLARDAIDGTRDWYLNENDDASSLEISPMFLPQLKHLPQTTVVVAGYDPLRDEGEVFADKLKQAGVLRRFTCFDSSIHAFLSFGVLPVSQQARQYLAQAIQTDLFDK